MGAVKPFLPNDIDIENGFDMAQEYINGLASLITVIEPGSGAYIDDYCRGVIFGQNGSTILHRIAKIVRNQDKTNIDYLPSRDGKRVIKTRKGVDRNKESVDKLKTLGKNVFSKVKENIKNNNKPANDEL